MELYTVTLNDVEIEVRVVQIDYEEVIAQGSIPAQVTLIGGIPGPKGDPGSGFTFEQTSPSDSWLINHNLGFRPSVDLFTTGGMEMLGEVVHISVNQTVVNFNGAIAGFARLN